MEVRKYGKRASLQSLYLQQYHLARELCLGHVTPIENETQGRLPISSFSMYTWRVPADDIQD